MNWQSFATAALSPVVIVVSRWLQTSIWTGLNGKWRVVNCWRSSCEIVWTRSAFSCKFNCRIWSTKEGVRLNGGIDGPTWLVTGTPDVARTAALTADSKSSVFPHITLRRAFQSFVWHSLGNIPQRDGNARLSKYSLTWSNTRWYATRVPYTWNTPWISRRPPHVDHNRNKHNACPVGGHSRYKQLYHLRPGFGLLLSLNMLQYFFDNFCLWFVYIIVLIDGNLRQLHPQERQHSKFNNEVYMIGGLVFFRPEILSTNKFALFSRS